MVSQAAAQPRTFLPAHAGPTGTHAVVASRTEIPVLGLVSGNWMPESSYYGAVAGMLTLGSAAGVQWLAKSSAVWNFSLGHLDLNFKHKPPSRLFLFAYIAPLPQYPTGLGIFPLQSKELAFWKRASHSHSPESRVWGVLKQCLACVSTHGHWRQELCHSGQSFQYLTDLAEPKLSSKKEDRANAGMSCDGQGEDGLSAFSPAQTLAKCTATPHDQSAVNPGALSTSVSISWVARSLTCRCLPLLNSRVSPGTALPRGKPG